jgi:hypothetical protein
MQEGLYFETDLIPFPQEDIMNVSHSPLSREVVLNAEQLVLKVLKLTVPVCYFAQFARPLWDRMKGLDVVHRYHALITPVQKGIIEEARSINSKSVSI